MGVPTSKRFRRQAVQRRLLYRNFSGTEENDRAEHNPTDRRTRSISRHKPLTTSTRPCPLILTPGPHPTKSPDDEDLAVVDTLDLVGHEVPRSGSSFVDCQAGAGSPPYGPCRRPNVS